MKSLRWRLAFWFGSGVLLVLIVFAAVTYRLLDLELRQKHWQRDYPNHPDWTLHGSYSEEEVNDVLREFIQTAATYAIPLCLLAVLIGLGLARKSLRPITELNQQLKGIRAPTLSNRIQLSEPDPDFRTLVHHINDLLERLGKSFNDMSEYAAKVAHELRTPLTILRLKLEQAGDRIPPELAEELHTELHELTHIVGQSLLIAKAEQGRLVAKAGVFDLAATVREAVSDFSLLAGEQGRSVEFQGLDSAPVSADAGHIRQIIHNLLTNALKHGQGPIQLELRQVDLRTVLTIRNQVRHPDNPAADTLGLGLRVVQTLSDLQPGLEYKHRRNAGVYVVQLSLPVAGEGRQLVPAPQVSKTAFDAGI
jgi:signal transduction histidine kinase